MNKTTLSTIIFVVLSGSAFGQPVNLEQKAQAIEQNYQALPPEVQAKLKAETSQENSQASNYQLPFELSVNERTGSVSLNYTLDKVPGMSQQTTINIGLSFSGQKGGDSMLGLPFGWAYQIDYLDVNQQGHIVLHLASGQQYILNDGQASGLRYYRLKDMQLTRRVKDGVFDGYLLTHLDGAKEWFTPGGLLQRLEDKQGNQLIYTYQDNDSSVDQTRLVKIQTISEDGQFQQAVDFHYDQDQIVMTYPDGNTTRLQQQGGIIKAIVDKIGQKIALNYVFDGDYLADLQVTYPTGKYEHIAFDQTINVKTGASSHTQIPAVSRVIIYPFGIGVGAPLVTNYQYGGDDGHNFTGYPDYPDGSTTDPEADALLQSDDVSYTYQVETTDTTGQKTITTYNHLHQAIDKQSYDSAGYPVSDNALAYGCANPLALSCQPGQTQPISYQNLPANYQTPSITQQTNYRMDPDGRLAARVSQVKTQFNGYGLPKAIYEYEKIAAPSLMAILGNKQSNPDLFNLLASTNDQTFRLTKVTTMTYDLPEATANDTQAHYGLQLQKNVYDCKANTWQATQNTLTKDHRNIQNQRLGMVESSQANGNICQAAIQGALTDQPMDFVKQQDYQYDDAGRKIATTLSWVNDGANVDKLGPKQATTSVGYHYYPTSHIYTVVNCSDRGIPISQTKYDATNGNKLSDWTLKSGQALSQLFGGKATGNICQDPTLLSQVIAGSDSLYDGTRYDYDALGRKIAEISPLGGKVQWRYQDGINDNGMILNKITKIQPTGYEQYQYIDSLGRQIKTADNMGDNSQLLPAGKENILQTYTYYDQTDLQPEDAPKDSPVWLIGLQGKLKSKTDALGNQIRYWYDPQGQVAGQQSADGNVTIMDQDPVLLKQTVYHNGNKVETSYLNDQKKVIKSMSHSTSPSMGQHAQEGETTSAIALKQYDGQGQLITSQILTLPH